MFLIKNFLSPPHVVFQKLNHPINAPPKKTHYTNENYGEVISPHLLFNIATVMQNPPLPGSYACLLVL